MKLIILFLTAFLFTGCYMSQEEHLRTYGPAMRYDMQLFKEQHGID